MGFLDSMVGELVRRETGFNATRLIRRIGSKRLLMMGGAALAGGMLSQKSQGAGTGSFLRSAGVGSVSSPTASGGVPAASHLPPLPTAGAAGLPGLPPVPVPMAPATSEVPPLPKEDKAQSQELLYAIVRTMVAAALSDGMLDPREKAAIQEHLSDSGLTDQQQSQIRRDLVIPAAAAELAGMLPEGEDPETLLEFAVLVLRADGELKAKELQWLADLAELLGVDESRRLALLKELAGDLFPQS